MSTELASWFSHVCGQHPEHIWAPATNALCCCQRCTGLYLGALVGLLAHLGLRPRLDGRFLGLHGWFLAAMVPLGFHWVPQGPLLRTTSGFVFALALMTYFRLPGEEPGTAGAMGAVPASRAATRRYWFAVLLALTVTLGLAGSSLAWAAPVLNVGICLGALVLIGAVGTTLVRGFAAGRRWIGIRSHLTEPKHA